MFLYCFGDYLLVVGVKSEVNRPFNKDNKVYFINNLSVRILLIVVLVLLVIVFRWGS